MPAQLHAVHMVIPQSCAIHILRFNSVAIVSVCLHGKMLELAHTLMAVQHQRHVCAPMRPRLAFLPYPQQ